MQLEQSLETIMKKSIIWRISNTISSISLKEKNIW